MTDAPWDMKELGKAPRTWPADDHGEKGVEALYYEGPAFQGRPTRVFAWLGMPGAPKGAKVPGVVLVHGGAGSAFAQWARQWNRAGYAAIAMDTCGCVPQPGNITAGVRHEWAGPEGWGGFDQLDWPAKDQWPYHAVADVILGHSLLRACSRVDKRRIGIMGISWGGLLTSIVAGVDPRLRFAVSVYGAAFLAATKDYKGFASDAPPAVRRRWLARWDPRGFLPRCRQPMLWVNGTNDIAFTLRSVQRSADATAGDNTLCYKVRMAHNYGTPWGTKEIIAFADGVVGKGKPLAEVTATDCPGGRLTVRFRSPVSVPHAVLCFATDGGALLERKWQERPAELDAAGGRASAAIPPGTTACFINLIDERGLAVSSDYVELPGRPAAAPGGAAR